MASCGVRISGPPGVGTFCITFQHRMLLRGSKQNKVKDAIVFDGGAGPYKQTWHVIEVSMGSFSLFMK